jgi:uncharacterized integral membrane protein
LASDRERIKAGIQSQSESDPELNAARLVADAERIELEGRADFFKLRGLWSKVIIVWISAFIIFHMLLTLSIGKAWLDFTTHKWLVPLIVVENFLQIVGMGLIVVRFFHPGHAAKT